MAAKKKCSVEIFYEDNSFITFDFDLFGIAIVLVRKKKQLVVYFDSDYINHFMEYTCGVMSIKEPDRAIITYNSFNEIEEAARCWQSEATGSYESSNLWKLLRENFPDHISKCKF